MFDDAVGCPGSVDDVGNDVPGTCIEVVPNAQSGSTLALASATIHIDGITVVAFFLRLDDSVATRVIFGRTTSLGAFGSLD